MKFLMGVAVILLGILIYAMMDTPEVPPVTQPPSSQGKRLPPQPDAILVDASVEPPPSKAEDKKRITKPAPEAAVTDESNTDPEDTEEVTGPFEVSFGQHTVHFAQDRGEAIQFRLVLTVPDRDVRAVVLRKKEELTRKLYFHGSRRRAEAMDLSGRDRLIDYLEPIYRRMVRNDGIQIEMRDYERVSITFPDVGAP